MNNYEVQAPNKVPGDLILLPRVFLGGSIEMDKAERWQDRLIKDMAEYQVLFLNPRRDDFRVWEEQSISNAYFVEQVEWELSGLGSSDLIVFYLAPGTLSPITLLEIGLFCKDRLHIICCPDGFGRKGNIEIVSRMFNFNIVDTYDDLISYMKLLYQGSEI